MTTDTQLQQLMMRLAAKQTVLPRTQKLVPTQTARHLRATEQSQLTTKLTQRLMVGAAIVSRLPITATAPKFPKPKILVPPRGKL